MVRRRGLGGTMLASVVFSVILVCGFGVYVSSQGRESLYSTAAAEGSLGDGFRVLEAAEAANLILGAQRVVASGPIACSSAISTVAGQAGSLSDSQAAGNLTVTSTAELATGTGSGSGENMSALGSFNGGVAGDLDLVMTFRGLGRAAPGAVFNLSETRYAHLGLHLQKAVGDCMNIVLALEEASAGSVLPNCTEARAASMLDFMALAPESKARGDGFSSGVSYSVAEPGSCQVAFLVSLEQDGIQGIEGSFSARFEEVGSVSLATTAS